jgi:gliding motility-associated-like protein
LFRYSIIHTIICLFIKLGVSAQNLVPNPSFEEYWECPQHDSNFGSDVKDWYIAFNSPEYFHSCSIIPDMGVPQNVPGYQSAINGNGYSGGFWGIKIATPYTEQVGVKLTSMLEKGRKYCLRFYVSLSDSSEYAIDRLGALFSSEALTGPFVSDTVSLYTPQIETPEGIPFIKKQEWEAVSGEICGTGSEEYLTIGNFHPNLNTHFYPAGDWGIDFLGAAYYYVDLVELIPCGICPGYVPELPNVLTPNGDGVNDEFVFEGDGITELRLFIYNRWGAEVYKQEGFGIFWNGRTNDGTRLTDGVYFYVIEGNGTRKSGTVSLFH